MSWTMFHVTKNAMETALTYATNAHFNRRPFHEFCAIFTFAPMRLLLVAITLTYECNFAHNFPGLRTIFPACVIVLTSMIFEREQRCDYYLFSRTLMCWGMLIHTIFHFPETGALNITLVQFTKRRRFVSCTKRCACYSSWNTLMCIGMLIHTSFFSLAAGAFDITLVLPPKRRQFCRLHKKMRLLLVLVHFNVFRYSSAPAHNILFF